MSRTTRTTLCTARQVISVTQSASTSARAGSATSVPLSAPSRYARSSSRFLATTAGPQEAAGSSEASGESSRSSPSSPRKAASAASGGVGETSEEAFRRNIREVREWRRRKESQRAKLPVFIPPSTSTPLPSPSPSRLSLSTLLASGAALGHSTSALSPAFLPYTYGTRSGLSIIDLDQTLPILRRTAALIRDLTKEDGVVLVVGSRPGHGKLMRRAKERMGDSLYTVEEWMPGTLTNAVTFFGIQPMSNGSYLPDIAIFLNPSEHLGAIRECTAKNIPTVGIVDSDTDPRIVTYPIPANMESLRTVELVLSTLSIAGAEGKRMRAAKLRETQLGKDTSGPTGTRSRRIE